MLEVSQFTNDAERQMITIFLQKRSPAKNNLWMDLCKITILQEIFFDAEYDTTKDLESCVLTFKTEEDQCRVYEELKKEIRII